jgi:hypothetical protein
MNAGIFAPRGGRVVSRASACCNGENSGAPVGVIKASEKHALTAAANEREPLHCFNVLACVGATLSGETPVGTRPPQDRGRDRPRRRWPAHDAGEPMLSDGL